jgi:hypothetical protein
MQTTVCVDPASQLSRHSSGAYSLYQFCDDLLIEYFGIVSRPPVSEYGSKGQVSSPKKNHAAAETARDLWLDACLRFYQVFQNLNANEKQNVKKVTRGKRFLT